MSIKSILVCLDRDVNTTAVLDVAIDLARQHDAHLAGAHAVGSVPDDERAFRASADRGGISYEWHAIGDEPDQPMALAAPSHDLLVVGQTDPSLGGRSRRLAPIERLLVESGRPVLIVPFGWACSSVGHRIAIGWNGTREAVRAVEDGMAILERAREVIVLVVNRRTREALSVDSLLALLERHGVNAEARGARSDAGTIGDMLLSEAGEQGCDLLVMGGYGHSRLREHLFGGPTYDVLAHMSMPVLMSH